MQLCAVPLHCFPQGKHLSAAGQSPSIVAAFALPVCLRACSRHMLIRCPLLCVSSAAQKAKCDHPNDSALMPDGTHYIGSLNADGQPHGQGASFHPDGKPEFTPLVDDADERKSGRWIDGKLNGPAVWMWINDDGDRFEGLFKNNQRDGPGAYSWKGGGQYEGEWAADHRAGLGARWSKDGKLTHCGRWDESKLMESCAVPLRLIPDGSRLSDAGQSDASSASRADELLSANSGSLSSSCSCSCEGQARSSQ